MRPHRSHEGRQKDIFHVSPLYLSSSRCLTGSFEIISFRELFSESFRCYFPLHLHLVRCRKYLQWQEGERDFCNCCLRKSSAQASEGNSKKEEHYGKENVNYLGFFPSSSSREATNFYNLMQTNFLFFSFPAFATVSCRKTFLFYLFYIFIKASFASWSFGCWWPFVSFLLFASLRCAKIIRQMHCCVEREPCLLWNYTKVM